MGDVPATGWDRAVVAGLDGSAEGLAAGLWAADEAVLRGVPLRLVHVREADPRVVPGAGGAELVRDAAARVRRFHPELVVATETVFGHAADALVAETTDAGPAGLLVLGSRGLGTVRGFLAGSVGLAVAAASHRPVVLVRAGSGDEAPAHGGDVVAGVDVFEPNGEVLAFAFREAAVRSRRLRAVACWSLPPAYGYVAALDPGVTAEVGREVAATLADLLVPWRQRFPSVTVTEAAVAGSPGVELVRAAAGAALLAVGRHRTRLPLAPRLGHVAHAVIHHASVPVAVVPLEAGRH
ncbi:universal stress protein [Streptomyces sp. TRM64462]|uniref:universal stress protein n=1 Tax=Streptomyces sp. TRM64462 TaxID=2741726 RepID=UPI001586BA57|nr:universal stress protein [Streptomyces sp. TRM64462]